MIINAFCFIGRLLESCGLIGGLIDGMDDLLTHKIVEAAKFLDLRVADHIIFTREGFYSYEDEGRI